MRIEILGTNKAKACANGEGAVSSAVASVAIPAIGRSNILAKLSATLFVALSLAAFASFLNEQQSAWLLVAAIVAIFCAGVVMFSFLTSDLRNLGRTLAEFKRSGFKEKILFGPAANEDEVASIGAIYSEMAERMIAQQRDLRDGDALRRDLIANVSHDLRTPLASLRGYIETLLVKNGSLSPEERRSYLEIAAKQSERLSVLVGELFELAKLEYDDFKIDAEATQLSELAQDVMQKFELGANKKQIRLHLDAPPKLSFVRADVRLMERALENLIENAMKYSPSGGEVRVTIAQEEDQIMVEVRDSGGGIPSEDLPFIFDRFYRVDKNRASSGAGLGLAITKRIVELHDSQISVTSSPKTGTCFSFALATCET
ncbi:MAG: sensor histidine kinase [Burkholderiales bacterium]